MNTRLVRWVAVTALSIVLVSCGEEGPTSSGVLDGTELLRLERDPADGVAPVDPDRGMVMSADQLDETLRTLFDEHVVLLSELMRRAAIGGLDVDVAIEALERNTDDLTAAVGLVYGPTGARAVAQLWAGHTQFLLDHANSARAGNDEAMTAADRRLGHYEHDFACVLSDATGNGLPTETVQQLLQVHVDQLTAQADAAFDRRWSDVVAITLDAQSHMADIAHALAGAIAAQQPNAFPGTLSDLSVDDRAIGAWAVARVMATTGAQTWQGPAAEAAQHQLTLMSPAVAADLASLTDATGSRLPSSAADVALSTLAAALVELDDSAATQSPAVLSPVIAAANAFSSTRRATL
ncbi:MAG: hypothetical protein AB7V43_14465 [Acidimicrobiia bacterium]